MEEAVCIIKAKAKRDYVLKGIQKQNRRVLIPYKDHNLFLRCIREAWFRLHLPNRRFWFNKEIEKIEEPVIEVQDSLITPEFLEWICDLHPDKQIRFAYSNQVCWTTVVPTDVQRPNLEYCSYDRDDCMEYGMTYHHATYMACYRIMPSEKKEPEYDIIYLGRDKGRAEKLLDYQKQFEALGLKTYFHICADRRYMRYKKPFYRPEMPYEDYLELLKRTKAHLNLVQEGQTSITQRDLESVFDEVKCITNNKGIKDFALYDPSRFFLLEEDDLQDLPKFLSTEFLPVSDEDIEEYTAR